MKEVDKANKWFWEELTYSERDKFAEQDLMEPIVEARHISQKEIIELYRDRNNNKIDDWYKR